MDVSQYTQDQIPELRNIPVYSSDGEELGHVGDAYYDEGTGRLEAVAIKGDALGFTKKVIPVAGAQLDDRGLQLPFGRNDLEGGPDFGEDDVDDDRYAQVTDYYGSRAAGGVDTDATVGRDTITRSEEELQVGTEAREAGSVRLRKWVETEPVEVDVELRRETARIEREPVNEVVSGAEFREEEIEVPLHEERPVVAKETVAKERIGVETDVEQTRETVRDEVRKERVDIDGDSGLTEGDRR